jgi:PncC family amidohydrolase
MSGWRELEGEIEVLARMAVYRGAGMEVPNRSVFTFAESCTGGMLAAAVTSVPGASVSFPGSVVTYSNEAKIEKLSVSPETIELRGAVSAECAAEMARGALESFGAMLAVSVTGIAGPGGGSKEKPVGTVWFALARRGGGVSLTRGFYPGHSRRAVQLRAVRSALRLLTSGLSELERRIGAE